MNALVRDDPVTALCDPDGLGAGLGDPSTFATWFAGIKGAYGLPMTRQERRTFATIAGGRKPPRKRVRELWAVVGRRAAKSRMAAALAVYEAVYEDHSARLAPGETGTVAVIAGSKDQAEAVMGYLRAFLTASPILQATIESETADEIRLVGNIVIAVLSPSFRLVRSRSLVAVVVDEVGYLRDQTSQLSDVELYRALVPGLATTQGLLIAISSPYRRTGLLGNKHRDHFGKDDPDVLVIGGPTELFNPTIDRHVIKQAYRDDPEAAKAEWGGLFRSDLSSLLDDAVIDAAIDYDRPQELPPRSGVTYHCFVDPSAGRVDRFTACVGHLEDGRFIADVVRGRRPPFDPNEVAAEYAALAREYGCSRVVGDNFAAEFTVRAFEAAGMAYERSAKPKSALYLDSVASFMRGAVSLPNDPDLIRELRLLERRVGPSGKDRVDHPQGVGSSDDLVNSVVGALSLAAEPAPAAFEWYVSGGDPGPDIQPQFAAAMGWPC